MGIPVVNSSATVTITNASPAVVSWTAHGLTAGTPVVFATTAQLPPPLVAGQVYWVKATGLAANSFQISAVSSSSDGTAVNTTGAGSGTHTGGAAGLDAAPAIVQGSFVATGQSLALPASGPFNLSLWGTFVATVQLQRSFDGGLTWQQVQSDSVGATAVSFTAVASVKLDLGNEGGVLYRLNCSAYTSGTVNYRLSTGSRAN